MVDERRSDPYRVNEGDVEFRITPSGVDSLALVTRANGTGDGERYAKEEPIGHEVPGNASVRTLD